MKNVTIKASDIAVSIAVTAIIVALVALVIAVWPHSKPKPVVTPSPCTQNNAPCIELADKNGKPLGVKFNDFRFGPQGCIFYLSLKSHKWVSYCGGYNLLWIGPQPTPGVEGKS